MLFAGQDAADKCVSVEFVFLEHKSSHLGDMAENITNFVKQIGDLENCSFRSYLSGYALACMPFYDWSNLQTWKQFSSL